MNHEDNKIINCVDIANKTQLKLKQFIENNNLKPSFATVLVGDNLDSKVYVNIKTKKSNELGIVNVLHTLPSTANQEDLEALIIQLNNNNKIHGILLQLPLPSHLNSSKAISLIDPLKDIDGLNPLNMGYINFEKNNGDLFNQFNYKGFAPATPLGVMLALQFANISLEGKNCVVMGRSNLVGLPTFNLLNNSNATTCLVHKQTKNIKEITKNADILIVAIGSANLIDSTYIKTGAIVIDVGINTKIIDNKKVIYGDCNTDNLLPFVSKITKVPMGIGRLTVISLMVNIVKACYNNLNKQ